jgi:WD40 repeat protein
MNSLKTKKRMRRVISVLLPLVVIILILAYYQLIYAPPKIDNGIARLSRVFNHHESDIWVVKFLPDNERMASCSVDGTVKIFERATGKIMRVLKHPQGVTHMDISADGSLIATSSYDTKVRIWTVADGRLVKELSGHTKTPWAVNFSPDGKRLLSCGEDASIRIWDVESGALIRTLSGHSRTVWDARFSPDGKIIASGSFDSKVKLWDASSGTLIRILDGHSQAVAALIFSHNGRTLATCSDDKTIKLWDVRHGNLIKTLRQPEHAQAVAFSPDDTRLLTGGRDKIMVGELLQNFFGDSYYNKGVSARLWDIRSGSVLQTFSVHANDANDVAYSSDARWMATGSSDKSVSLWEVMR